MEQTTLGRKRTVETLDSSSQRKMRAKEHVRRPCHESAVRGFPLMKMWRKKW